MSKEITAKDMCAALEKDLKAHDWKYSVKELKNDRYAIDTDIRSSGGVVRSYEIRFVCNRRDVTAIVYFPLQAPEALRNEVAAYLTRLNWSTRFGKYDLDFADGEVRAETIFLPESVVRSPHDVNSVIFRMVCGSLDEHSAGLAAVISGCKSAAQAFAESQAKADEEPPSAPAEPPAPPAGSEDPLLEGLESILEQPKKRPRKKSSRRAAKSSSNYSTEGLNLTTPVPLKDIIAAVKTYKEGKKRPDVDSPRLNILLSGAPGSGKTAFVKHLADEVGSPLKVVKASDLIGRYTGQTEKAIAKAFEEAKDEGAILFLDEIDSFLQDRAGATHSWEVTQVNELLQQMEDFEGVMVGATNFADNLDKAVLRRFTYKLKLDYLTDEGKRIFFERYFKTPLTEEEGSRLDAISNLTPGDFRTVREELFYLEDKQSNSARLEALEAESAAKGRARAKIGFAA